MSGQIVESSDTEQEWVVEQLVNYNRQFVPVNDDNYNTPLNFNIKIDDTIVAGINAVLMARSVMFVSILWVDEKHRGNHYGSTLLNHVETKAKKLGAKLIYLDTIDFQAPEFYRKYGYKEFGELENYIVSGRRKFFMKKEL